MRVLAAPDKFRGTATAAEVAGAIAAAVRAAGGRAREVPLSDGGEGFLEVFGGPNRATVVTGPLGEPVEAEFELGLDGHDPLRRRDLCGEGAKHGRLPGAGRPGHDDLLP